MGPEPQTSRPETGGLGKPPSRLEVLLLRTSASTRRSGAAAPVSKRAGAPVRLRYSRKRHFKGNERASRGNEATFPTDLRAGKAHHAAFPQVSGDDGGDEQIGAATPGTEGLKTRGGK